MKIFTVPNIISFIRILLSPLFFLLFFFEFNFFGLIVFLIAAFSDFLDGFFARRLKQESKLGKFIDPFADKLMIALAVIVLVMYFDFPALGLMILFRDLISLLGFFYVQFIDKKIEFKVSSLGKTTTLFQIITFLVFVIDYEYKLIILVITIIVSLAAGIAYLVKGIKALNR